MGGRVREGGEEKTGGGISKGWEAGEKGEYYATTLNIAPSKESYKKGREPEM